MKKGNFFYRCSLAIFLCVAAGLILVSTKPNQASETSVALPEQQAVIPTEQSATVPEDYDPFLAEFENPQAFEPEIKVELPAPPPPPKPGEEVSLAIHLPYLGDFKLIPYTDETKAPPESGLKFKFADDTKKINLGGMIIDDGEIKLVNDKLSITGRATILGNKARFGLRSIQFGAGANNANRFVLGVEFESKPTLSGILPPDKKITLEATDLEFEANKPITLVSTANIGGQSVRIALVMSKTEVDGFVELPPGSLLSTVIPSVADKPTLQRAVIKNARIRANNLWNKDTKQPLHVVVTGLVEIPPQDFQNTLTNDPDALLQPTVTTPETLTETTPAQTQELNQLADAASATIIQQEIAKTETVNKEQATKKQGASTIAGEEELKPGSFKLELTLARAGQKGSLKAKKFPIPGLGTIDEASITIDTMKDNEQLTLKDQQKASYFKMSGTMNFDVADATPLALTLDCKISSKGFVFSGKVTDFIYAGVSFKNLYVSFDTGSKAIDLIGALQIPHFSNTSLEAELRVVPDKQYPKDPSKRAILFSTKTSSQELKPFAQMPGLESFYVTNFNAGLELLKIEGKTSRSFYLAGTFHFLGTALDCTMRLVKNTKNEEGIYIKAPLAKEKKVSDAIKGFTALDSITLNQAEFVACTVDYIDLDAETGERTEVKKGLSLLASVPLKGALAPVGTFFGMSDQIVTLYGQMYPNDLTKSSFGFLLSKGTPDPEKTVSLGETKFLVSGLGATEVATSLYFHPSRQEELKFAGKFIFKPFEIVNGIPQPASTEVHAAMQGIWKNPFGLSDSSIADLALMVGMNTPAAPNKLGGGGKFKIGDFKANVYFAADTLIKDIALKAEVPEPTKLSELATKILKAYEINLGNLQIPDPRIEHLQVEMAPKDVLIGDELIRQGFLLKGDFEMFGKKAYVHIMLRPPTITGEGGFKIYGAIDPINIGNGLLTVEKSGKEFGGTCFVPTGKHSCSVPDTKELQRAGQEFIKGKEIEDQKPRIDIELTLKRQNFLISGSVNIANLFGSDTCMSIDNRGLNFMMEAGMRNRDGEVIMHNNKPLFLARLLANADFSKPDKMGLSIDFMQNLQEFIRDTADQAFRDAQREVVNGINKAQQEIGKIDGVIADAHKKFEEADRQFETAKKNLEDIKKAKSDVEAAFAKAKADVDSLSHQIKELDEWYDRLPPA